MRSLPPIYIPTGGSADDIDNSNDYGTDDGARENCWQEEEASVRNINRHRVDPSENVVFVLPSAGIFRFKEITHECTVEFAKKRLELELGLPSDAFQLASDDGKCRVYEACDSSTFIELIDCAPKSSANVRIEICPILQRIFRLTFGGNVDEILSSGTLDLLDTPFLKSLPCEDVIRVVLQRAFLMMYLAANRGHLEIVDTVLKKNIDPNTCTHFGRTPLHVAAFHGRLDVVELLLSYGADVSHRDSDGKTPQEISTSRGYTHCIHRLWLHRWNLRPPLVTPRQQNERYTLVPSSGKATPLKNHTRSDVVRLWPIECSDRRRQVFYPRKKYQPLQNILQPSPLPWLNSKTRTKLNSDKLLRVGHDDVNQESRCRDTRRATTNGFQRATVSICTVVNLNSPFIATEFLPIRNYESDSPTDNANIQSPYATKEGRRKDPQINQQNLLRKLKNFHRPEVPANINRTKTPPDFQTWLLKKNTEAKEEAIVELVKSEKTLKQKNDRKQTSERAYKTWFSSKRR